MPHFKNNSYLYLLVITSIILYAFLAEDGLFIIDENEYLHMSQAIYERLSLDCAPHFKGFTVTGSNMALPLGFFEKDGRVYALPSFGFPLIASLFYGLFKASGLQLLNVLATILTALAVFFFSRKIWRDKNTAYISATLYIFCTFSLFYALSLWYHSLITLSFFISMVSVLYFNERKWTAVFLISSAICIWTAYYMFVPIAILFLFFILKSEKKLDKLSVVLFFFVILFISWAYNDYIHSTPFSGYFSYEMDAGRMSKADSFTDFVYRTLNNVARVFHGFIAMFICRFCVPENLHKWAWCQKSILESSPFLITALPGFIYLYKRGIDYRLKFILLSATAYVLMILYGKTNTFGSWTLSMRYLLPVIPLMAIIGSGFISKFLSYRFLYVLLLVSTIFSYFSQILFFDSWYYVSMLMSLQLVLSLLLIWLFQGISGRYGLSTKNERFVIVVLLISLISLSNFININDVKIGNEFRAGSTMVSERIEELTGENSVILLPRAFIYETNEIRGRIVFYYSYRGHRLFHLDYPDGDPTSSIENTLEPFLQEGRPVYAVIRPSDEDIMKDFDREYITWLDTPLTSGVFSRLKFQSDQKQS